MSNFKFNLKIPSLLVLLTLSVVAGDTKKNLKLLAFFSTTTQQTTSLSMSTKRIEAQRSAFIEDNIEEIQIEIAQGEGEYLNTLAHLYAVENVATWKNDLQKKYLEIFAVNNIKPLIQLEKHLKIVK